MSNILVCDCCGEEICGVLRSICVDSFVFDPVYRMQPTHITHEDLCSCCYFQIMTEAVQMFMKLKKEKESLALPE